MPVCVSVSARWWSESLLALWLVPGQTVLLCSTAQSVHLHALDESTCLDGVRVRHQIGKPWEGRWRKRGSNQVLCSPRPVMCQFTLWEQSTEIDRAQARDWKTRAAVCVCWHLSKCFTFLSCQSGIPGPNKSFSPFISFRFFPLRERGRTTRDRLVNIYKTGWFSTPF